MITTNATPQPSEFIQGYLTAYAVLLVLLIISFLAAVSSQGALAVELPPGMTKLALGTAFNNQTDCTITTPLPEPVTYPVGTTQIAYQIVVDPALVQSVSVSFDKGFGGPTFAENCNKYIVYQGQPRQVQWGQTIRRLDNSPLPPDTYTLRVFLNGSSQASIELSFTILAQATATPIPPATNTPIDTSTPPATSTPMDTPTATDTPTNRWESIGPDGGTVNTLAIDPINPTTLYAGSANGVYKSIDAGATWGASNSGIVGLNVAALLFDPTMPSTLYAGTQNGVFKSTDGGASWTEKNNGRFSSFVETMAIDPTNPQVLYTGGFNIHKSADGGESWSALAPVTTTSSILSIAVDPTTPSLLYAGTYVGLFKSVNGGQGWTQLTNGIPADSRIHQIVIHPNNPSIIYLATINGIYKSTNKGDSWSQLLSDWVTHLVINRQNPAILYAGTAKGIFKSTNNGSSWSDINQGLPAKGSSALANAPQDSATVYLAQYGIGIFKSGDGGASWTASNRGLTATGVVALVIDPNTPDTLYAGTDSGAIFKSTNRGVAWNWSSQGLDTGQICGRDALAIDPKTPSTLYAGTRQGVFKSTNGGTTWTNIFDVFFILRCVVSLAVDPTTPTNVYLGLGAEFYKRTDGGANGTLVTPGLPNNDQIALSTILVDPKVPTTLYLGTDAGIYKSTNGGSNWQAINNGLPNGTSVTLLVANPQTPATIYAGTGQGLYFSTNSGENWSTLPLFRTINGLVIHPQKPTLFFAVNDDGAHYSLDAGETWHRFNEGLPALFLFTLVIDPKSPEILYTGTAGSGVFKVQVNDSALTPLTITVQPADHTIVSGQSATLTVTATGLLPLTYQWYQGNRGDISNPINSATSSTFTTPSLIANRSFWVRVTNAAGRSVDSATANITVVTQLQVSAPATATAGVAFNINVTARDSANAVATGYLGTINFTSGDGQAQLPSNYTFTNGDQGSHSFPLTLSTKGTHSLTVRDIAVTSVQGNLSIQTNGVDTEQESLYLPLITRTR